MCVCVHVHVKFSNVFACIRVQRCACLVPVDARRGYPWDWSWRWF